ncbi:MAG: Na-translocating system protein MpsC family protein [Baekduia sp.]
MRSESERGRPLTAPTAPLTGDALLTAVTKAMVTLHERHYHRAPTSAKSQLMGNDLLACVLGGVYTDVEKTLIELERGTIVQENRSAFQHAMQDRFISDVQRLSGRHVLAFISNQHVGPDMEIELFVLGSSIAAHDVAAP